MTKRKKADIKNTFTGVIYGTAPLRQPLLDSLVGEQRRPCFKYAEEEGGIRVDGV